MKRPIGLGWTDGIAVGPRIGIRSRQLARPPAAPAYAALADRIRLLVLDGRLALGTRLPAERELAAHLSLSRTTISAAYAELRDSGYLDSLRGSGSVVRLPSRGAGAARADRARPSSSTSARPPCRPCPTSPPPPSAPRRCCPPTSANRVSTRSGCARCGRRSPTATPHAACRRMPTSMMITIGAQHAIGLLARTLLSRGDRALVESPDLSARLGVAAGARRPPGSGRGHDRRGLGRAGSRAGPPAHQPDPRLPDARLPQPDRALDAGRAARARRRRSPRVQGTTLIVDETMGELGFRDLRVDAPLTLPFAASASATRPRGSSRSDRSARPSGAACAWAGSAPTTS